MSGGNSRNISYDDRVQDRGFSTVLSEVSRLYPQLANLLNAADRRIIPRDDDPLSRLLVDRPIVPTLAAVSQQSELVTRLVAEILKRLQVVELHAGMVDSSTLRYAFGMDVHARANLLATMLNPCSCLVPYATPVECPVITCVRPYNVTTAFSPPEGTEVILVYFPVAHDCGTEQGTTLRIECYSIVRYGGVVKGKRLVADFSTFVVPVNAAKWGVLSYGFNMQSTSASIQTKGIFAVTAFRLTAFALKAIGLSNIAQFVEVLKERGDNLSIPQTMAFAVRGDVEPTLLSPIQTETDGISITRQNVQNMYVTGNATAAQYITAFTGNTQRRRLNTLPFSTQQITGAAENSPYLCSTVAQGGAVACVVMLTNSNSQIGTGLDFTLVNPNTALGTGADCVIRFSIVAGSIIAGYILDPGYGFDQNIQGVIGPPPVQPTVFTIPAGPSSFGPLAPVGATFYVILNSLFSVASFAGPYPTTPNLPTWYGGIVLPNHSQPAAFFQNVQMPAAMTFPAPPPVLTNPTVSFTLGPGPSVLPIGYPVDIPGDTGPLFNPETGALNAIVVHDFNPALNPETNLVKGYEVTIEGEFVEVQPQIFAQNPGPTYTNIAADTTSYWAVFYCVAETKSGTSFGFPVDVNCRKGQFAIPAPMPSTPHNITGQGMQLGPGPVGQGYTIFDVSSSPDTSVANPLLPGHFAVVPLSTGVIHTLGTGLNPPLNPALPQAHWNAESRRVEFKVKLTIDTSLGQDGDGLWPVMYSASDGSANTGTEGVITTMGDAITAADGLGTWNRYNALPIYNSSASYIERVRVYCSIYSDHAGLGTLIVASGEDFGYSSWDLARLGVTHTTMRFGAPATARTPFALTSTVPTSLASYQVTAAVNTITQAKSSEVPSLPVTNQLIVGEDMIETVRGLPNVTRGGFTQAASPFF